MNDTAELLREPQALPTPLPNSALAELRDTRVVPALIADCGEQAAWRYTQLTREPENLRDR